MKYLYYSGCGRIELWIPEHIVNSCHHSGPCDADVAEALAEAEFRAELDKIDPVKLAEMLSEYTDWDVSNHEINLGRLVWIAAGDIQDEPDRYTDDAAESPSFDTPI